MNNPDSTESLTSRMVRFLKTIPDINSLEVHSTVNGEGVVIKKLSGSERWRVISKKRSQPLIEC